MSSPSTNPHITDDRASDPDPTGLDLRHVPGVVRLMTEEPIALPADDPLAHPGMSGIRAKVNERRWWIAGLVLMTGCAVFALRRR